MILVVTDVSVYFQNSKRMEEIFSNPGLDLISAKIVQNLDYKSLIQLSKVSQSMKTFIENERTVWILQVQRLMKIEIFPFQLWHPMCDIVCKMDTLEIIRFVDMIQEFVDFKEVTKVPNFHKTVELEEDLDIIKFLEDSYEYESIKFLMKILEKVEPLTAYWISLDLDDPQVIKSFNLEAEDIENMDEIFLQGYDVTLLMRACINGKFEIVRYLLTLGTDVDVENSHGNTALDFACELRHSEIVNLLVLEDLFTTFVFKCLDRM